MLMLDREDRCQSGRGVRADILDDLNGRVFVSVEVNRGL